MPLEVANTIKKQLLFYDSNLIACLGSHNFRGTDFNDKDGHNGFLEFNVSNLRDMKIGIVRIELNYKDLYNIKVFKGKDYDNLFANCEDIYEDILTSTLENILGT